MLSPGRIAQRAQETDRGGMSVEQARAQPRGASEGAPKAPPPESRRARALALAGVFGVIAAALAFTWAGVWRAGIGEVVPAAAMPEGSPLLHTSRADVSYEAWLAARHARTLLRRPWRLFDTEHCAPERHSLTYGIPMIAMGVLAIPASLATQNPVAIYNATLALQSAVAALAMLALVRAWTGCTTAALVAALLFAFHPMRLRDITHPTEWDIAWTGLALLFAERLFASGRWRDALAFAAATSMQVAASFYQLLSAVFLGTPFAAWLLLRRGAARPPLARIACALALVALAAALVLGPYLAAQQDARIGERAHFAYASWDLYAPGGTHFLGLPLLALAALGLAAPRRLALPGLVGDPRLPLLAGAAMLAFFAAGPDTAVRLRALGLGVPPFDPYRALAAWLPGLDAVRGVLRLSAGVHLVACILAGAGAAALLRLAGRRAPALGAGLVAAALFACFGAPLLGVGSGYAWRLEPIHPGAERIAFFEQLALMGNAGPLLELPLEGEPGPGISLGAPRILLQAWHGRRTSACFGSYASPHRRELAALAAELPSRRAVAALREQGFTTVVLHHPPGFIAAGHLVGPFERAAARPGAPLASLQRLDAISAFALLPEASGGRP